MAGQPPDAGTNPVADEGSDVHAQLRELQTQYEELQRARDEAERARAEVRKPLPPTPTYTEKVCGHHLVCSEPMISRARYKINLCCTWTRG